MTLHQAAPDNPRSTNAARPARTNLAIMHKARDLRIERTYRRACKETHRLSNWGRLFVLVTLPRVRFAERPR